MKKTIILAVLITAIFSCSTSKTVQTSKKIIKGNWTLTTITCNQPGKYKITLLNDASKECFEGSEWRFIPNNNTGIYLLSKENCYVGERNFIFTIHEVDPETGLYNFLLKPTNEKNKYEDNKGFRLKLSKLSDTTMIWEQLIMVDGKRFKIDMNFNKTIE